ncbi:hypothetical protein DID80_03580 [Candidatus Marinamargulisbacteria bacterium SCGC AAA071-K20]|nr:hypothetical protein DID80_03580 [Candidatus Marinamargulisbacteria bacterium SCGC AAA071-K20]
MNEEILNNEDLFEMPKNNPPDVVFKGYSQAFFEGVLRRFRRDKRLEDIVMTDADVREQAIKHFFSRVLRLVKEQKIVMP